MVESTILSLERIGCVNYDKYDSWVRWWKKPNINKSESLAEHSRCGMEDRSWKLLQNRSFVSIPFSSRVPHNLVWHGSGTVMRLQNKLSEHKKATLSSQRCLFPRILLRSEGKYWSPSPPTLPLHFVLWLSRRERNARDNQRDRPPTLLLVGFIYPLKIGSLWHTGRGKENTLGREADEGQGRIWPNLTSV